MPRKGQPTHDLPNPSKGGAQRKTVSPLFEGVGGVLLVFFGCALLTAGICIPPAGVIDSSVLVAFGEILTFAGSLIGIDYHYRYTRPPLTPPSEGEDAE